jgi:predicted negative regulator of RcsB-dependent stress response
MEPLEHFLISLAKEGLIGGELHYGNRVFTFSKSQGKARVDVTQSAAPPLETPATEKREPEVKRENDKRDISRYPEARKAPGPYKYLLFLLIFVAAILLAIFGIPYLSKSAGQTDQEVALWNQANDVKTIDGFQNYLKEYPQGRYSVEALGRIQQIKLDQSGENDFQSILTEARSHFNRGDYHMSLVSIEKARKIKNSQELNELEDEISSKIAASSTNDRSLIYLRMARQALEQNELQTALKNVKLAREIEASEQVINLEEKISEQIRVNQKESEYSNLIGLARAALEQNQLDSASGYLKQAAEIRKDEQVESLLASIEIRKKETGKKENEERLSVEFNRLYTQARDYFDKGEYVQALEAIQKAKTIRSTKDVVSLEKEIIRIRDGLESEKQRIAREKLRDKTEQDYRQAITQAKTHLKRGEYSRALKKVGEAKKLMDTGEARMLETQISNLRNRVQQERTVKLIELPAQMINSYNEAIKRIEILKLARGIKALGQISLSLKVRADGKIVIQQVNDSALKVFPPGARRNIKIRILRKIGTIFLTPPIDKKGMGVTVSNWRISFSVGTFMNKIILRRKF